MSISGRKYFSDLNTNADFYFCFAGLSNIFDKVNTDCNRLRKIYINLTTSVKYFLKILPHQYLNLILIEHVNCFKTTL